jgi:DNA-binding CsgD family transcriptional regulator
LLSEPAWDEVARALGLSARELQIARAVLDDKVEAAIAGDLGMSTHTVHAHLRGMFPKLGVHTRAGLVMAVWNELAKLILAADGALPPLCRHRAAGRCPLDRPGPVPHP